jgi:hypothetical protein
VLLTREHGAQITLAELNSYPNMNHLSKFYVTLINLKFNEGKTFDFVKHTRRESINVLMRLVCGFRYTKEMSKEYIDVEEVLNLIQP